MLKTLSSFGRCVAAVYECNFMQIYFAASLTKDFLCFSHSFFVGATHQMFSLPACFCSRFPVNVFICTQLVVYINVEIADLSNSRLCRTFIYIYISLKFFILRNMNLEAIGYIFCLQSLCIGIPIGKMLGFLQIYSLGPNSEVRYRVKGVFALTEPVMTCRQ